MEITERILTVLEERQAREGSLPQFVELYRKLILLQKGAGQGLCGSPPLLTKAQAVCQLSQGIPLVTWNILAIDWPLFLRIFQESAAEIGKHSGHTHQQADYPFEIPELQQATKTWYENKSLSSCAGMHGLHEELLESAIACSIKPFLKLQAKVMAGLIEQDQWRRGYCPACGGKPDFAFLDKERGARWLLCSRCDTEWLFQRLECPYCGNTDQKKLAFLADEQEVYRLYVCDSCRLYLKAIDLRQTGSEILLPLERVLTFDMDRQGQEKGYGRGSQRKAEEETDVKKEAYCGHRTSSSDVAGCHPSRLLW